jgi:mRNA (guanine-N7-)-methyltransferase
MSRFDARYDQVDKRVKQAMQEATKRHYDVRAGAPRHRDNLMRRHNNIKNRVIETAYRRIARGDPRARVRVLDAGCGRGGDLMKWAHQGPVRYTGVDISPESIGEAARRADQIPKGKKIQFEVVGLHCMSLDSFTKDAIEQGLIYDVISLQFVLNYVVDTTEALRQLTGGCLEMLAPGGSLLITAVDSSVAARYMHMVGDDYFSLRPIGEVPPGGDECVGRAYDFYMRNCVDHCTEFMVPISSLTDVVTGMGMRVQYCTNFSKFDDVDLLDLHTRQRELTRLYYACEITTPKLKPGGDMGPGLHDPT